MKKENKVVKLMLNNKDINFLVVSLQKGKILSSGETEIEEQTFDNTYMDVSTICVGKQPKISFNFDLYSRKQKGKEPVWVHLNYEVLSIEEVEIEVKEVKDESTAKD